MAIVGIDTLLYGVQDLEKASQFLDDFGLQRLSSSVEETIYRLAEGSTVIVRSIDHASMPDDSAYRGFGVKETIWGVDTEDNLQRLVDDLKQDREVTLGDDGAWRFYSDCGLPLALRVFDRQTVIYSTDPINSSGNINRLNQHRKWRRRAIPKTINHVVFAVKDYWKTFAFFRDRLNFRMSDHQKGIGTYLRADGAHEHHNTFLLNCEVPGAGGIPRFHHTCFGVEDFDEVMIGSNHMTKRGWTHGFLGIGRHRIGSAIFCYFDSPVGGETEYGADTDYLDDNWVPREWEFRFGTASWMTKPPSFMLDEIPWDVGFYQGEEAYMRELKTE
ncbi:VOC family protein [Acinetobacter sp. ANC 4173]|uniref:VOC family protein n=1 Tax=Acinetobacter sp. ANC 4173 TaxID=2529837 RepID=UPI00103BB9BD|nr:VOC family protein [Acinetobacter sp. ANC 4173]TCB73306.1 glyoxalase [Acinetobacter sp. ANC 4173]